MWELACRQPGDPHIVILPDVWSEQELEGKANETDQLTFYMGKKNMVIHTSLVAGMVLVRWKLKSCEDLLEDPGSYLVDHPT